MHPTLSVLIVFEVFITFTLSLTVPVGPSLSLNAPSGIDVSANSSIASPSFSPEPSANTGLAVNPEVKEYTVFPQQPHKFAQVSNAIQAFAVKDSVRTIPDPYRPKYGNILYWQLRASPDAAQQLKDHLGSDVDASGRFSICMLLMVSSGLSVRNYTSSGASRISVTRRFFAIQRDRLIPIRRGW